MFVEVWAESSKQVTEQVSEINRLKLELQKTSEENHHLKKSRKQLKLFNDVKQKELQDAKA